MLLLRVWSASLRDKCQVSPKLLCRKERVALRYTAHFGRNMDTNNNDGAAEELPYATLSSPCFDSCPAFILCHAIKLALCEINNHMRRIMLILN